MKLFEKMILSLLALVLVSTLLSSAVAGERYRRSVQTTTCTTCTEAKCAVPAAPAAKVTTPAPTKDAGVTVEKVVATTTVKTKTRQNRKERRSGCSCINCTCVGCACGG